MEQPRYSRLSPAEGRRALRTSAHVLAGTRFRILSKSATPSLRTSNCAAAGGSVLWLHLTVLKR